jgi:2-phospho-L-lactate/phosphoenolpyruvate guanylyltransferase
VLVVSPDRDVLHRAVELGARTLRQRSRGLNAGLAEARVDAEAGGAEALLVLPIDLPFVTTETITSVIEPLAGVERTVVLVPDRHGTGTNALGLRPPDVIDFAFGPRSRGTHRSAAEAAGALYVELGGPLAVDLDTPDDYVHVQSLAEDVRAG